MMRNEVKRRVDLRLRGSVLDGYPRKLEDAQKLFYFYDETEVKKILNKRKQAEAHKKNPGADLVSEVENNTTEDSFIRNKDFLRKADIVYPDFVIWLNASLEWVKERLAKADLTEEQREDKRL
jgi:hypothetical protein